MLLPEGEKYSQQQLTRKGNRLGFYRVCCVLFLSRESTLSFSFPLNRTAKFRLRERTKKTIFFESNKILRLFYVFCRCRGCFFVHDMLFSSLFHRLTFLFDCMQVELFKKQAGELIEVATTCATVRRVFI